MTTAALVACGNPTAPQFGAASYRIEGLTTPRGGGEATHTIIYRANSNMRVEATLPAIGSATVVFDEATGGAYALNPGTTPRDVGTDGEILSPAGIAVRIEDAQAPQPLETPWAALGAENARAGGRCTVAGERGREWRPREQVEGAERHACITEDGIVLMVTENGVRLWEATSLQRGPQDAALFGVPAGYRMIDPQAIASSTEQTPLTPPAPPPG